MRERAEVVTDKLDRRVPIGIWARRREDLRVGHEPNLDEEPLDGAAGDATDEGAKGDRNETERDADSPFATADRSNLERGAADEYNENLNCDLCNGRSVSKLDIAVVSERRTN